MHRMSTTAATFFIRRLTEWRPQGKNPRRLSASGVFWDNSLTMTYFHTGCSTIIGAKSFHGPVRDGKGWYQLAMVIRHDLSVPWRAAFMPLRRQATQTGRSILYCLLQQAASAAAINDPVMQGCEYRVACTAHSVRHNRQGYRDKPHGQLVLVSLTHYCASTPSLSTSWSRTTL